VHGTFFWDQSRRFVLVQILNSVELATEGELVEAPEVQVRVRMKAAGARIVWPEERELRVEDGVVRLSKVGRYTAVWLKVG
jgi:hypothetical protein